MSYKCTVCGKSSRSGNTISHSHKATKRFFRPNLQRLNFVMGGKRMRGYVCVACIKSEKVQKTV